MTPQHRRQFLTRSAAGLGALASLLSEGRASEPAPQAKPRAKRIIYLFQSGAPSQLDLFDHKPGLKDRFAAELPDSIRKGQRLTGMTATQESFPVAPSKYTFQQHGKSGAWVSSLLPHTAKIADDLCFIKSMHTEAINHDPAITFCQTGAQLAGRPSIGAWVEYGLGSLNKELPAFVVLVSSGSGNLADQPLYDRLWGSGFLPSKHQGVKFRSQGDPVLFLRTPDGISDTGRRRTLDDLAALNKLRQGETGDPETETRIQQYEMAFRMQSSVPELTDLSKEDAKTFELYGDDARKPGTFAANCLLARRLAERDVRFIQLYHRGWDQHTNLPKQIEGQCRDTDRASAALITDLKRRGLLDDTLVIWGGEFGRTVYCQGKLTAGDYGRDHHPRCFTVWLAGGGVKPGQTYGETDDFGYNIVKDPVDVHDLNATVLHCLGLDHTKLTYRYQGRDFRLTDVHGNIVKKILT
ncbi:DUF1501 domain-containing protein [Zavarzinella formosa]|uniref:DUF1501 domain-containing protein n=1 Tax=Zavarzinella formosa TaxID=360055 RepID=UPI0002DE074B|nr:DUF1501 domain-containing protein [Zavarzinella formosa]